mmetsp:Transcript_137215/g.293149  ORF Transcript_137215/g.293149 Transcript_137215/m.293149 type:complete len:235 (+) Transcript_137215:134-838(+)
MMAAADSLKAECHPARPGSGGLGHLGDHLVGVLGELILLRTELRELILDQRLPRCIQLGPRRERERQPRCHLRVQLVHLQHRLGHESIARAVRLMEARNIPRENTHHGTKTVWVLERKIWVLHEFLHTLKCVLDIRAGLQPEPLVHDERIACGILVEGLESCLSLWLIGHAHQVPQCCKLVGHASPLPCLLELRHTLRQGCRILRCRQVGETDVPQSPLAGIRTIDNELLPWGR